MKHLTPTIVQLELGIANAYLLKGKHALTLVDTGAKTSSGRLERELGRAGVLQSDLEHIIVTHAHFDHAGGLAALQRVTAAQTWTHRLDAPYIRTAAEAPRPHPSSLSRWDRLVGRLIQGEQPLASVQHELEGEEDLGDLFDDLQSLHLPGHSPGQLGLWFPQDRLLIGGDVVAHFVPWRLTLPLSAYTADREEALCSIQKVARLGIKTLAVGHGSVIFHDAQEALERLLGRVSKHQAAELA